MKQIIVGLVMVGGVLFFTGCENEKKTPAGAEDKVATPLVELNDMNFASLTAQGVVLVEFGAPWCGFCKEQEPILEKVAVQLGDTAKVVHVNTDVSPRTAEKFGIETLPTIIIFKNGKPVLKLLDVIQAEELLAAVKAGLRRVQGGPGSGDFLFAGAGFCLRQLRLSPL